MTAFVGRTVLVTGAASGIGRATATAFASAGARVVLADRADLSETVAQIGPDAGPLRPVTCDVSDPDSVAALFASISEWGAPLDVSVNCAGILVNSPIAGMSVEAFDRQIAVNLRGSFLIAQHSIRAMRRAGRGRLILIASELAHLGRADAAAYCASKAGVIGLTRALARECAPDILVNAVAPGPVDTPMLDLANMPPDLRAVETANPLGRVGQPSEIADAVLYLAGPGARFVTGQTLSPSGGAIML